MVSETPNSYTKQKTVNTTFYNQRGIQTELKQNTAAKYIVSQSQCRLMNFMISFYAIFCPKDLQAFDSESFYVIV